MITPLVDSNYLIFSCVWHDCESIHICTMYICHNYTMCIYMLLANPSMSPHWINVFTYVFYVYHMHLYILAHYRFIYISMHRLSMSLHPFPVILKRFLFLVIYVTKCNLMVCSFLIFCPILTNVCYHHVMFFKLSLYYMWMFILASVLLLWVMTGMV